MGLENAPSPLTSYEQWRVEKLSDFIAFLEERCTKEESLFRGQARDWPLLPKLGRLYVPAGRSLLKIEESMLEHFSRTIVGYLSNPPTSPWDLCALAQHHGMATRLLDWTYNPLAALWFALENPGDSAEAVVWMFCPSKSDIIGPDELMSSPTRFSTLRYWKPRHVTPRIRAQKGAFTVHPFVTSTGSLQSLQEADEHLSKLTKIAVPRWAFRRIRYQLDRCGVDSATIYPEIEGLARHVEWLYSFAKDSGSEPEAGKHGGTIACGDDDDEEEA